MSNYEPEVPSPQRWEMSRRRLLRNLGVAAVAVPFAGALTEALTDMPADASPRERFLAGKRVASNSVFPNVFATHPSYKFTFVNHVTTNTFFTATIYGLQDAASILGIPTPQWTGSANSIVAQMVTAFNTAVAGNVDGIATTLIDPVAFNTPVNNALAKGIPVVAYNADEAGNNRMCYVGQSNLTAGAAAAERIVASGLVKSGELVGMIIATPGSGNIQPRIDGALPIFKKAGYNAVEVAGGAAQTAELAAVDAWYLGHKSSVKFLYSVDSGDSIAVATTIAKYKLAGKVGGSGWDVGTAVLQQVQKGALLFSIDQQAYLQGLVPTTPVVPLQHLGWVDEAVRHGHRPRLRDTATAGAYLQHTTVSKAAARPEAFSTPPKSI